MNRISRALVFALSLWMAGPALAVPQGTTPAGLSPNGDGSGVNVTATGGQPRSLAAMRADAADILDILPQASASTDFTTSIKSLTSAGKKVYLPNTGTPYAISDTLTLAAGSALLCDPGVVIQQTTVGKQSLNITGAGARIDACQISGGGIAGVVNAPYFTWVGGGADSTGGLYIRSDHVRVERTAWTKGSSTAISIDSAADTDFQIINNEFENNVGFGIWATNGASNGLISGNWTNTNGIELVGITYSAHHIRVTNNYAHGTGDNCFSITGYDNTVTGNIANGCAFTGIYAYGDQNVITGNTAIDNGQVHNPAFTTLVGPNLTAGVGYQSANTNKYAAISANGNFGGGGQVNIITGNYTDDDQTTMTQDYSVSIGSGYANWAAGTSYASGAYTYSNGATWQATAAGTSGSTAPSGTSNVSDGGVTWKYLKTLPVATREPSQNIAGPNVTFRFKTAAYNDATINHNNTIISDGRLTFNGSGQDPGTSTVTGGFQKKVGTNYANGQSYTAGQFVYTNTGSNLYRVVAPGAGTTTTQPTHTSGVATTADGYKYLFINSGAVPTAAPQIQINSGDVTFGTKTCFPLLGALTAGPCVYAGTGTPLGVVAASPGSLYLRADGGAGATLYVKETATDTTGWVAK